MGGKCSPEKMEFCNLLSALKRKGKKKAGGMGGENPLNFDNASERILMAVAVTCVCIWQQNCHML